MKSDPGKNGILVNKAVSSVNTADTMIRNLGTDLPLSRQLPALIGIGKCGHLNKSKGIGP